MRKINTKIENGRVFLKIEHEVDWDEIINITSYMLEMGDTIMFENGDTEEHYNNLLDKTENFKYTDCETLFSLGLLDTSTYDGKTEFLFSCRFEEEFDRLKRLYAINTVIDD